jgi:ADP-ribose pyrophosphatase YjhB (NUDIX family)
MSEARPHLPAGAEPDPDTRYPLVTVGALIEGPSGRLLFIRTHKWGDRWGVPGGKVDWGETLLEAVHREVREETGLEVEEVRWAPVQEAVLHPEFHRPAHFVLINVLARSRGETVSLNDEAQAFAWCTVDEAEGLDLNEPTRHLLAYHQAHAADAPRLEPPALRGRRGQGRR